MTANKPPPKGLIRPHVHYSFSKTASEGLSQSESDSESLAQEIEYQLELQERIHETEKLVDRSSEDPEEDSLEEDSLEKDSLGDKGLEAEERGSDAEETQGPNGRNYGKENCGNASQEKTVDRYSELRYDPNWKNNKEGNSFAELEDSHQVGEEGSPILSLDPACSHSQLRFMHGNNQLQEGPQNIFPHFGTESSSSCDHSASTKQGSHRVSNKEELIVHHSKSSPSTHSDSFSSHVKECKHGPEKDFVEKNKLTLGLATRPSNSYLQEHAKKLKENRQGQGAAVDLRCLDSGISSPDSEMEKAHLYKKPRMGRTESNQARLLEESSSSGNPVQHQLGHQVELRGRHHNTLEFENSHTDSNTYGEVSDPEQDSRLLLHQILYPNPSITSLCACTANNSSWDSHIPTDPAHNVDHKGKPCSMKVNLAPDPPHPNSYQNFPGLHLPCTTERKKKTLHAPENPSESCYQYLYRCTVSEPKSLARHGKCQNFIGHRSFSSAHHAGPQQPVSKEVRTWDPRQICTEKIPRSYVSGNSGPSQPAAHNLIKVPSPATRLIQAAERHHQEISRLADAHLTGNQFATMFPPIIQRGESDSQLNTEGYEESQPVLSRSNSEGYLLQMEKQKEKKEKENRKGSRTKGYVKMDVKLGGLGPDYEAIKEKSEKIKQQKEYAKQVKEHNLKNIASAWKPPPKPENKSAVSRQKALEYAKTIPKPKLFVSRPSEQEPRDEKNLARTLNGENLPPISSLESLQNRHEKEKQVVAAFKTLHIV